MYTHFSFIVDVVVVVVAAECFNRRFVRNSIERTKQ